MGERQRPDALDLRILELLTRGYDDARVAYRVGLSHRSVQRRVQWLMTYLGATGRVALGARAYAAGLITISAQENKSCSVDPPTTPTLRAREPRTRRHVSTS
ncbi:hypothetical protein ACTWP5_02035 [Streptomyces sp. 4N509B]|uniref:hypothetical protein n=1 Tax=Streptomyces sp. 4N509B TaxID=3457413 RepID=UPI003FCEFD87